MVTLKREGIPKPMGKGASQTLQNAQSSELSDANALTALASGQSANANTLFNASLPGFEKSQSFYGALSSGDPAAIARAIAPVSQQADASAAASKKNILQNGPAGGEKNLALEQVDVNRGADVGSAATQGYLNSFNSLAALSQGGISSSQSATGLGISGLNSSASTFGNVGNQAIQQKGQTLGAFGSLGGDAATLGGAAIGKGGGGGGKGSGGEGAFGGSFLPF